MGLFKAGIEVGGRQQVVFAEAGDDSSVQDALLSQGVQPTYIVPAEGSWNANTGKVMVPGEDGMDVEYPEIMSFPESEVVAFGSESALELLTEAGVNEGMRQYAVGLDKQAAEIMGEAFYPGDEVIIRRALLSSIERLRYVARKAHDANAEQALHRQIEEIGQVLIRWDAEHPGAKLAI
jgi:hypothetical protein